LLHFIFEPAGLLGHSLGAGTVAHFAEQKKVQAVVALDLAWDNIYKKAADHDFKAPFLEVFSSQIYLKNKFVNLPYLNKEKPIRKDKFLYVLSNKLDPTQKDYTIHMSFSDQSTLVSQPTINKAAIAANNSADGRFDGLGNGWNIAAAVNEQLLLFFNRYLKDDL
jgi:pimeloyl-ACP methyl ester carboxylesterase